jgi:hypothetical protein
VMIRCAIGDIAPAAAGVYPPGLLRRTP